MDFQIFLLRSYIKPLKCIFMHVLQAPNCVTALLVCCSSYTNCTVRYASFPGLLSRILNKCPTGSCQGCGATQRSVAAEARARSWASAFWICGGESGTGTGFSPSTSVSPVSIIPPMLRTHSFIYHRRCKMFFFQYFSLLCQYHSTNAPYSFILLPRTLYNLSNRQYR
jgi:hypothetical protein